MPLLGVTPPAKLPIYFAKQRPGFAPKVQPNEYGPPLHRGGAPVKMVLFSESKFDTGMGGYWKIFVVFIWTHQISFLPAKETSATPNQLPVRYYSPVANIGDR